MKKPVIIDQLLPHSTRYLSLTAAMLVFLVIVLGGIMRVTGSGSACLDWPTCLGAWTPPADNLAQVNYWHRLATLLAAPLLALATLTAWRRVKNVPWISLSLSLALVILVLQVALGGLIALGVFPAGSNGSSILHMTLSLVVFALIVLACGVGFYVERREDLEPQSIRLHFRSPFARLSLLVFGVFVFLLVSGAIVSVSGAGQVCAEWPLCNPLQQPDNLVIWLNFIHRLVVGLSGFGFLALLIQAWRTQRSQPAILVSATAGAVLFFAQALLGAQLARDFPVYLLVLHQATAVAVFAALVILLSAVGMVGRTAEEEAFDRASIVGRKGLLKDFLMLTKPIVVVLLLVTTYAGMVIGAQAWPPISLVFWTLLGGFMAAGGSGAINQYIDRYDDTKMQRTQKRPIPSGRMTPAEGLAFGVALTLASFYVMVAFVNLLAAMLSLAGIIYYVLLYSIFLKKTTVQNIVIGGGAGAIPPLVGWAAATGSLNVPSMFLFAVIFMWTPPHFWALALVRRKDYARAGVPMLPVIRGEKETRWQIFLYTLELVGLTLLLPLFGLGGSLYLIGAALLGLWLLSAAWRVWKQGGNKLAWKMYRYSSMYLAFIFIVLMVDRLL